MSVLVLGAGGLLGSAVVAAVKVQGRPVFGTYHSEAPEFEIPLTEHNIRDTDEFQRLLDEHDPDAVVNCAAMTDVDGCESNEDVAFDVNGEAPGELAQVCDERDVQFVHVSTDYVFDGEATTPYSEDAPPNPIQAYGKSKLKGERAVQNAPGESLIVRLSFVYGVRGDTNELTGFPAWVRDTLHTEETVPLFTDQHITPSRAGQAAATILGLLEDSIVGTYHVAARSCVTPYEFGEAIARVQGADAELLRESEQDDVTREAARPRYTCLDVSKVESDLGYEQPTLEEDLEAIADQF